IEHAPRFNTQGHAISGIQAHTDDFMPIPPQLFGDLDCTADAVERVVGVYEEDAIIRQRSGIILKCLALAFEEHDPTVRLRAAHGNAVALAREQIRCPRATADVSSTRRTQTSVYTLSAAQTELDDCVILCGARDTSRFRGDETLKV